MQQAVDHPLCGPGIGWKDGCKTRKQRQLVRFLAKREEEEVVVVVVIDWRIFLEPPINNNDYYKYSYRFEYCCEVTVLWKYINLGMQADLL